MRKHDGIYAWVSLVVIVETKPSRLPATASFASVVDGWRTKGLDTRIVCINYDMQRKKMRTREQLLEYKRQWRQKHPGKTTRELREAQIRNGTAFCDCSRPAVIVKGNQFICKRCLEIDEPGHQHRNITPRKHRAKSVKYGGHIQFD